MRNDDALLIAKEYSKFNEISIHETSSLYGKRGIYRTLRFSDEAIQGAMDMNDPGRVVLEYQIAVIHLMEVNDPSFESVFVIGHGIGTIASHYSDKLFKIAEIDERVVELSRQYFSYRLSNVIIGDGRRILEEEEPDTYDYILLDAFSFKGTPLHLITREFFDLTATKLRNRGAVILNCMGKIKNDRLVAAIHTTLREVYAYTKAFFLPEADGAAAGNAIIVGSFQPIDFQARNMAGFKECEIEEGHLIRDSVY